MLVPTMCRSNVVNEIDHLGGRGPRNRPHCPQVPFRVISYRDVHSEVGLHRTAHCLTSKWTDPSNSKYAVNIRCVGCESPTVALLRNGKGLFDGGTELL